MKKCNREIFEKIFNPIFGSFFIEDISTKEIQAQLHLWRERRDWSPGTFNRRRSLLSTFFSWCVEQGYKKDNPVKAIKKLREDSKEEKYLTSEELEAFLRVVSDVRYSICFMILLNTGARIGEVLGLSWKDIDFNQGWLRISKTYCKQTNRVENRTKSGKGRIVGLNEALKVALLNEKLGRKHTGPNDLIVVEPDGSGPGHHRLRDVFEKCLTAAGLELRGIHELRHTYASHFMMNGGNLWDLKTILGHSTIDLTERYSHFAPKHLKDKAEKVSFVAREKTLGKVVNFSDALSNPRRNGTWMGHGKTEDFAN